MRFDDRVAYLRASWNARALRARSSITSGGHVQATAAYVTDQAVCSAGNFFTAILAARHLSADHFGVFALLNVIIILSLTVNNWLIRSSLSRTSQLGDSIEVKGYTSTLVGLASIFGLAPAALLICAASALHHAELCVPLTLVAVAMHVQETLRRSAMAQLRYRVGVLGDIVSYLGQALIIGCAVLASSLSLTVVFWAMGATSALSVAIQTRGLQLGRPAKLLVTARKCWEQGRWITLSGFVLSPIVYGMPWILEITRGQAEAGVLSGLILVLGLSNPLMFSSTWLILVRGQAAKYGSISALLRRVIPTTLLTSTPLFAYWMAVFLFPGSTLSLFYGDREPYNHLHGSLQLVVIYYLVSYIAVCLEVMTDTREKSHERIRFDIWISGLMLSIGLLSSLKGGLPALLCVGILAHAIRAVSYSLILARPSVPNSLSTSPLTRSEVAL
jgi:hypothetical protein